MEIQDDFKELLKLFNGRNVEYLVVGGYALAFHGVPRHTGDIDLWVKPTRENAERILAVLKEFGFGSLELSVEDFVFPNRVTQLGYPPVRVDIVTSIDGVGWEEAWAGRVSCNYASVPIQVLGRDQLVANKRTTARKKDIADLESLGETT